MVNNLTILIPMKDEEENLPLLLKSIEKSNSFLDEKILVTIFFLNDKSTDGSENIVLEFIEKNSLTNVKLINVTKKNKSLAPRQGVLEFGLNLVETDYVTFVDADCEIGHKWLDEIIAINDNTKLAFGYTSIKVIDLLSFIQSTELFILFSIAFGLEKIGLKSSCMGNNILLDMGFLKEIGGYKNLGYSYNDDQLLYRMVYEKYGSDGICAMYNAKNYTAPLSLKENVKQKLRWLTSGLKTDKLIFLYVFASLLFPVVFLLLSFALKVVFLISFMLYVFYWSVKLKEDMKIFRILYVFFMIFFYPYFYFFLLIIYKFKKISWKGNWI